MYRKTFCQSFLQFFRLLSRGARCCKCTARGDRCQICASAAAGGCQRHGHTPQKVLTYAAVPSVLPNGVVIYQNTKNAHELERIVVAAPVTVGTSAEKMYTAVMLQRDPQTQRLYLHDEITEKELDIRGTEHLKTHRGSDTTNSELYTADILRNALNVKSEQLSTGRSIDEMAGGASFERRAYERRSIPQN